MTWSLEVHVVHHCNLRCAHCCTLSPALRPRFADPERLRRDLVLAAGALAPAVLKLTGGEPLLHPDLVACLDAVRDAGISPRVSLTTNGHLAARVPDAVFERLDGLTLSLYPSAPLADAALAGLDERCERHGVALRVKWVDRFAVMDATTRSRERARSVHASCWLKERCHLVHEGRFYACTRPPHLAELHRLPELLDDGVPLEGPGLRDRIRTLLESGDPVASCELCSGVSGTRVEHAQLGRGEALRA